MENVATGGLIDLGSAFFVRGELEAVEKYYRQALELARRGKARRNEARALLSLGSLFEQKKKPEEARQFIEAALPFYRQAGYRRELVQAMLILGRTHVMRAEFDDGVRALTGVLPSAQQLQDKQLEAMVRERLGENLRDQGAWPDALAQQEQAARLLGPKSVAPRLESAELYAHLGRTKDAEQSFNEVEQLLQSSPNRLLLFDLRMKRAELAYQQGRMQEALAVSRQALSAAPAAGDGSELAAKLMEAVVLIRTGQAARGNEIAQDVIQKLEQANLVLAASSARLTLAEALTGAGNSNSVLRAAACGLAIQALAFFEPRRIWESVWRAHAVAAQAALDSGEVEAHHIAAASALAQLKSSWPPGIVEAYLQRADLKLLSAAMKF